MSERRSPTGTIGPVSIDGPSDRLKWLFLVAIVLMLAHKVECWWTGEWMDSPFFQSLIHSAYWAGRSPDAVVGEAMFLTFIVWLFAGLVMGWLVLRGGVWPTIALGVWGLTFVLEWHHLVRTALAGGYYSGLFTAVVYLTFGLLFFLPELRRHVHLASRARSPA